MTTTVIPDLAGDQQSSPSSLGRRTPSTPTSTSLEWPEEDAIEFARTELLGVADRPGQTSRQFSRELDPDRTYPHLFDEGGPAGQALLLIGRARDDARMALESFGDADLESVSSRLAAIAALMARAHQFTRFNESYGAVVSFLRRSALAGSGGDTSRSALNMLLQVLSSLSKNPAIDLEEAAELVDLLESEGWHGTFGPTEDLLAILLESTDGDETTDPTADSNLASPAALD